MHTSSVNRKTVLPVQFWIPLRQQPGYNCTAPTELLVPEQKAKNLLKPNRVASIFAIITIERPQLSQCMSPELRKGIHNKQYVIGY